MLKKANSFQVCFEKKLVDCHFRKIRIFCQLSFRHLHTTQIVSPITSGHCEIGVKKSEIRLLQEMWYIKI